MSDEVILDGFKSLHEAMATGFDRIEQRFNGVDQRFDRLEQRVGTVEQRLDRLEQRVGGLEQRIGDLDHRMMLRFDEVGARLDGHQRRIAAVETQP